MAYTAHGPVRQPDPERRVVHGEREEHRRRDPAAVPRHPPRGDRTPAADQEHAGTASEREAGSGQARRDARPADRSPPSAPPGAAATIAEATADTHAHPVRRPAWQGFESNGPTVGRRWTPLRTSRRRALSAPSPVPRAPPAGPPDQGDGRLVAPGPPAQLGTDRLVAQVPAEPTGARARPPGPPTAPHSVAITRPIVPRPASSLPMSCSRAPATNRPGGGGAERRRRHRRRATSMVCRWSAGPSRHHSVPFAAASQRARDPGEIVGAGRASRDHEPANRRTRWATLTCRSAVTLRAGWRAGGRRGRPGTAAPGRPPCTAGSWRSRRGRAVPGPPADRRRGRADGWRTSGAARGATADRRVPSGSARLLEDQPDVLATEPAPTPADEHRLGVGAPPTRSGWSSGPTPGSSQSTRRRRRRPAERHDPLLGPLAEHPGRSRRRGQVTEREPAQLRHPHAGGVEQLEHALDPDATTGSAPVTDVEQPDDLLLGQRLGQPGGHPGRLEIGRRVVGPPTVLQQEAMELTDDRDLASDAWPAPDRSHGARRRTTRAVGR